MIRDTKDGNKDIITMFKGTDAVHKFKYTEPSGSTFIWSNYDVIAECRLAVSNEKYNFTLPVTDEIVDDIHYGIIKFPKESITTYIREPKVYWRVIATDKVSGDMKIINYGEIWLKEA